MKVELRPQFWIWLVVVVWAICAFFVWTGLVSAHDIYTGVRDQTGQLCCGGNDCEAVTYTIEPSGDAVIDSKRYGVPVLVAKEKITWLPVPGGEAFEAHWCGRKKDGMSAEKIKEPEQIDPLWYTYCAFIAPGGV